MAEQSESIREDSAQRVINEKKAKEVHDWNGKRVVLPRGETLPTEGLPGEVFVKINSASKDQMYIFDEDFSKFITVGPIT